MPSSRTTPRPDLSRCDRRRALPLRKEPYWSLLEFCRHLGYQKRANQTAYWIARLRTSVGNYKQHRLGAADCNNAGGISYADAVTSAYVWFRKPDISFIAADA